MAWAFFWPDSLSHAFSIPCFQLANAGQAILCTIHQPASILIENFDRLLLLERGGETVYFGPIGKDSKHLVDYFAEHGAHCPSDVNPAEVSIGIRLSFNRSFFTDLCVLLNLNSTCSKPLEPVQPNVLETSHGWVFASILDSQVHLFKLLPDMFSSSFSTSPVRCLQRIRALPREPQRDRTYQSRSSSNSNR